MGNAVTNCQVDHEALKKDEELREKHADDIGEMMGLRLFNCRGCRTTLSVEPVAQREAA